jgi:hypothetical protein
MNKKVTKTLIKHYKACFEIVKQLVNGFVWKWHFLTNFEHEP